MRLSDLVVIDGASGGGIFTAPQAAAFPIGVSLTVTMSRAMRTIFHWDTAWLIPMISAAAVTLAILGTTVSDWRGTPRTRSEWITTLLIASANGCVLFAAAIGIEKI